MRALRTRRRLLLAAMFVDTLGGGLFAPYELLYALRIAGLSLTLAGLLVSIAAGAALALGPIAGAVADRMGSARVVAAANVLGAVGCVILVTQPDPFGYAIGVFLLTANMRVFWAAFVPLVSSVAVGNELEAWFGRLRGARYVGIVAGEAMSSLVFLEGTNAGLRTLVLANGLSFIVALVLVGVAIARAPVAPPDEVGYVSRGYRFAIGDRLNLSLAGMNVAATLLLIAPPLILPVYVLSDLGLPAWLPGVLAAVLTVTAAAGLFMGSRLVRGRRRLRNLQIATVLLAAGCGTLLLASLLSVVAAASLFAGVILLGTGEAFYAPTADAIPAALAPPDLRGRYAALHQMAWGVSETIGPVLAAMTLAVSPSAFWLALVSIALVAALAYRLLEALAHHRDGIAGGQFEA